MLQRRVERMQEKLLAASVKRKWFLLLNIRPVLTLMMMIMDNFFVCVCVCLPGEELLHSSLQHVDHKDLWSEEREGWALQKEQVCRLSNITTPDGHSRWEKERFSFSVIRHRNYTFACRLFSVHLKDLPPYNPCKTEHRERLITRGRCCDVAPCEMHIYFQTGDVFSFFQLLQTLFIEKSQPKSLKNLKILFICP